MYDEKLNIETNVRSLSGLLDDLRHHRLLVPPFQRDFVWERDDVRELFKSIVRNYPIGSVILWKPYKETDFGEQNEIGGFILPSQSSSYDNKYVLDGFQRLSSLFGCLTNPQTSGLKEVSGNKRSLFTLYYDLEAEDFIYLSRNGNQTPSQIPVYVLMSTSEFRKYARNHIEKNIKDPNLIDVYLDRADILSRTLLDYKIACVEIANANINEAVDIFSRVNSKGTEISFDWMVNALSYSSNFRFADRIDALIDELSEYNWSGINRNTIFRCVQSSFGKLYIDQTKIEDIAKRTDFAEVCKHSLHAVKNAVEFLYKRLHLVDSTLLPYGTQLVLISLFFMKKTAPTEKQLSDLENWFWKSTYSSFFTVNSLAFHRKAYDQMMSYLKEETTDLFYGDVAEYAVPPLPDTITMGSVRAKAFVLYILRTFADNQIELDGVKLIKYEKKTLSATNMIVLANNAQRNLSKRKKGKAELYTKQNIASLMDKEQDFIISLGFKNQRR